MYFSVGKLILLWTDEKHCFGNSEKKFFDHLGKIVTKSKFSKIQNRVFVWSGANSNFPLILNFWTKLGHFLKLYVLIYFKNKVLQMNREVSNRQHLGDRKRFHDSICSNTLHKFEELTNIQQEC
jgi:hypothetical protein